MAGGGPISPDLSRSGDGPDLTELDAGAELSGRGVPTLPFSVTNQRRPSAVDVHLDAFRKPIGSLTYTAAVPS
jgi:hypothetical protein